MRLILMAMTVTVTKLNPGLFFVFFTGVKANLDLEYKVKNGCT